MSLCRYVTSLRKAHWELNSPLSYEDVDATMNIQKQEGRVKINTEADDYRNVVWEVI